MLMTALFDIFLHFRDWLMEKCPHFVVMANLAVEQQQAA